MENSACLTSTPAAAASEEGKAATQASAWDQPPALAPARRANRARLWWSYGATPPLWPCPERCARPLQWGEAGAAGNRRPSSPVGQGRQPQQLEEQLQGMLQVQVTWHSEVSKGRRQVGCRSSADQQPLAIPTMRPPLAKAVAKHVAASAARLVLSRSQQRFHRPAHQLREERATRVALGGWPPLCEMQQHASRGWGKAESTAPQAAQGRLHG